MRPNRLHCAYFAFFLSGPRWEVASPGLQPERWMEWGTFEEWAGLGTKQLHHTSEQPGKAFMVPWASVTQCSRVSVEQSHQWQLPGSWKREQPRAAIHLAQVRRTCLPLQDQYHLRWKGKDLWIMLWGEEIGILIKRWHRISSCRLLRGWCMWEKTGSLVD